MRSQAAALKALLDEPRLQVMPGCGDGMGARLIEEAGFRTGFVSGSSVSAMRLAMPDMDLVSFNEMADAVESCIAAAPNVLWLADGDTGHGNALAVQKVIRAYARRGAAAVLIEDKIWPRPLGREGAKLVVDREHAILRCRAAVEACRDKLRMREVFRDAGLRVPWFRKLPLDPTPEPALLGISYPCVLKPLSLSASQGVMRANHRDSTRHRDRDT